MFCGLGAQGGGKVNVNRLPWPLRASATAPLSLPPSMSPSPVSYAVLGSVFVCRDTCPRPALLIMQASSSSSVARTEESWYAPDLNSRAGLFLFCLQHILGIGWLVGGDQAPWFRRLHRSWRVLSALSGMAGGISHHDVTPPGESAFQHYSMVQGRVLQARIRELGVRFSTWLSYEVICCWCRHTCRLDDIREVVTYPRGAPKLRCNCGGDRNIGRHPRCLPCGLDEEELDLYHRGLLQTAREDDSD